MTRRALVAGVVLAAWCAAGPPVTAQTVSGVVYEDRDADGIRDAGEPALPGVQVDLYGVSGAGAIDSTQATAADGSWAFAPGNGCYLVRVVDPPGWRVGPTREDGVPDSTPGYTSPVGIPRFSHAEHLIDHLRAGTLRYSAMGDSIAWNFNICGYPESFWYSLQVRSRLQCVAPSATINLDEAAIKGEHTDDLLVDDAGELNNVFRILEAQPRLVSLSMIGNDLLDVDPGGSPTQQQINRAVSEVLDARRNLQEFLSTLVTELPDTDVTLNSLYDNEAYNCYTGSPSDFHRAWLPIVDRILRDLAWGQARRVAINEVAAEFAHEDQLGDCDGYDGLICRDLFQFDTIHPTNPGYTVVREKSWEALGGVLLGPSDPLGRVTVSDVNRGYLRLVRRLSPRSWQVAGGAVVQNPQAALDGDDQDAAASVTLGAGAEELRLGGFPDWFDEIEIVRALVGVRYRTSGTVADDFYRVEASVDGQFAPPPGHAYQPTQWNFVTPIVGGGGPNQPAENPDYATARLLVRPDVAVFRDVTATLSKDPVLPAGAAEYVWPAVTHEDLATSEIRVVSAPVAGTPGNDPYQVEVDHAWIDLYGWEKPRPAEVAALTVDPRPDGGVDLSFEALPAAERYNVYFGRLATVRQGSYDHGAGAPVPADCAAAAVDAGNGRMSYASSAALAPGENLYLLVTAHVANVESPAGNASGPVEIDRSQSVCR